MINEDEEESSSICISNRHSCRIRSASIIDEETTSSRRLVRCDCYECNGSLIDPRTKLIHESINQDFQSTVSFAFHDLNIQEETSEIFDQQYEESSSSALIPDVDQYQYGDDLTLSLDDLNQPTEIVEQTSDDESQEDFEYNLLSRQRVKNYKNRQESSTNIHDNDSKIDDDNSSESSGYTTEEDINSDNDPQSESESDDIDHSDNFEDYSPPDYEPFQNPTVSETFDDRFLWILLWILSFRIRFNISEIATDTLIKFMKIVLCEIGGNRYSSFPDSIYMIKKSLGLKDIFHIFVPCSKCHKLYKKNEVVDF